MSEIHIAREITGGGLALDGIRTATIADNDCCFVQMPNNVSYVYRYEASSSASESSPDTIIPNDNSTGTGAWLKQTVESTAADYAFGHWRYSTANGVQPGTASTTASTVPLNEEVMDEVTVSGAYPSSYRVYLPAGTYRAWGYASCYHTNGFQAVLYDDDTATTMLYGSTARAGASNGHTDQSIFFGYIKLAGADYVTIRYDAETAGGTLGYSAGLASIKEVHAELMVWSVT